MKGIKPKNIEKFEEVILPSFKFSVNNEELPRAMSHIKLDADDEGDQLKGGV